jgi:lambda family phage tail tape measure protein
MTDVAKLSCGVDSSALVDTTRRRNADAEATRRLGEANARLAATYNGAGNSASFWEAAQERLNARLRQMQEMPAQARGAMAESANAGSGQRLDLQGLLGEIDPTVGALNRLATMEEKLGAARDSGLLKPQVWEQYQAKIDETRASTLELARGSDGLSGSIENLNLRTAEAQKNVASFVLSMATGDMAGARSSLLGLASNSGLISAAFSGAGLTVAGFTAAVATGLSAWKQGSDELFSLQKNLLLSGQNADVTYGQFARMIGQLDQLEGVNRDDAIGAIDATARSGRFSGEQFDMVASAAARMQASVGVSVDSTVAAFERIAADPVDALLELNRVEGFLTQSQIDRIYALQQEGLEQEATSEALRIYHERSMDMAAKAEQYMPALTVLWRDMKGDVTGTWGAVVNLTNALTGLAGKSGALSRMPRISDVLMGSFLPGGGAMGTIYGLYAKSHGLPSIADRLNNAAGRLRNPEGLPENIEGIGNARTGVTDPRNNGPTPENEKCAEILAKYKEQLASLARRSPPLEKRSGADPLLDRIQQQIAANERLSESAERVSESQRLVDVIDEKLAVGKGGLTAAARNLLVVEKERLQNSERMALAGQRAERDLQARAALVEQLASLEKQRNEQVQSDLIGMGRGADASQLLQRELAIQRQYAEKRGILDKAQNGNSPALTQSEYDHEVALLEASKVRSLDIERSYQQQRLDMLGDWRLGVSSAWEDYTYQADNAMAMANGLMNRSFSAWEDAWVNFAKTGKLSFSGLIDSMISDLVRYAARQALIGLIGGVMGRLFPTPVGYTGDGSGPGSIGGFGNNLDGFKSHSGSSAFQGFSLGASVAGIGLGTQSVASGQGYLFSGVGTGMIPAVPTHGRTASGEAAMVNVAINNAPPGTVGEARVTHGPNGEMNIDVLLKQVDQYIGGSIANGSGATYAAQKSRFGLREVI